MKVAKKGFTLIELLIVVAIIAILAAIAIPNFLAAQVRAKVSRVKGEFHSIAIGIESYYVDQNAYIPCDGTNWVPPGSGGLYEQLYRLTTPITYLSTPPNDPFAVNFYGPSWKRPYQYYSAYPEDPSLNGHVNGFGGTYYGTGGWYPGSTPATKWVLDSLGPDAKAPWDYTGAWSWPYVSYDPTNGTVSAGDIYRTGP